MNPTGAIIKHYTKPQKKMLTQPNRSFQGPGEQYGGGAIGGVASAVGLLGGFYDTYQTNKTARENTNKTIAAQKAEAELAYQRQVQMWHMQNAYNSPAEQMKRFGAAGLNPHLIYGQGNPGNAQGTPQYQAPNIQYRYAAPAYGAAVQSVLPTLMSVGTWMQNMRQGEIDIAKTEELVRFLLQKNPREIRRMDNALSLFPYQESMLMANQNIAWNQWRRMEFENLHLYGDNGKEGMRAIERAKAAADLRLKGLAGDYYEPAMIMKLVGGSVAALAGAAGLGRIMSTSGKVGQSARQAPKRIKTFYDKGKRRSQVVDY